jgi:hypothetical protein
MAGHIAAAKVVMDGVEFPRDLLDIFLAKADSSPLAGTVVVHACAQESTAEIVVEAIVEGNGWQPELVLRILVQSAKHQSLKQAIAGIVRRLDAPNLEPHRARAISVLKKITSTT